MQPDAAMPRSIKQIAIQQPAQILQNVSAAGRVQPMTAVVDRDSIDLEAAGVAAHLVALLQHDRLRLAAAMELPRGAQPGGAGPENGDTRYCHGAEGVVCGTTLR